MDRVKVILFGMTGQGNNALKVLMEIPSINLLSVFTPKRQDAPYPYYQCEQLQDIVLRAGISLYEGLSLKEKKTHQIIKRLKIDIIVVSSFNQIIPKDVISMPKFGVINIHPSLLPKYRGATPTVWALMNGEEETGVTAHFIEDEGVDSGRIITQSELKIEPADDDGVLRFKLANISESVLTKALSLVLTKERETFHVQNESEATYYPKRSLRDAEIKTDMPFKKILNKIKAMSPYPGAYLRYCGKTYILGNAVLLDSGRFNETCDVDCKELVVKAFEGMIKFKVLRIDATI